MGLEDTLEQLNTMITESRRSVRTLKEEVQKLDDLYQQKVKEAEEEDKNVPMSWSPWKNTSTCWRVQLTRASVKL